MEKNRAHGLHRSISAAATTGVASSESICGLRLRRIPSVAGALFVLVAGLVLTTAPLQAQVPSHICDDPLSTACLREQKQIVPPAASLLAGSMMPPVFVDPLDAPPRDTRPDRASDVSPQPPTDLQRLTQSSTGEFLPIFGRELFQSPPSTFAPGNEIAIAPDYIVGPGDDVLLRIWGAESFNGQLTVDRSGSIYIPKVGPVHIAGLRFDQLQGQISAELSRLYRNFNLSVNMGTLRSIQIYVVGEAQRPGAYTISSLSTVLNALFASGGPNTRGSLRHIQVRRPGKNTEEFDLYDFLLRGDKSKDLQLEAATTIFIPPVGAEVGVAGSVRHPAIYELNHENTIESVLALAGGLSSTAVQDRLSVERIDVGDGRVSTTIKLDESGKAMLLRDGDVLFVGHIAAAYDQTVTIRGNLANPGRFPWHEGMRLSDIIPDRRSLLTTGYWRERNRLGVPVPLFEPATDPNTPTNGSRQAAPDSVEAAQSLRSGVINGPSLAGTQQSALPASESSAPRNVINIPAPEIDWSYAVIERLNSDTLKNVLIPFNLGRLVQDYDASQDLVLRPGDTVTILSQDDIAVSQAQRTKYIRLEGEFGSSGVYSANADETLADVVRRAGGLTPGAYLYGSSFSRKSAQIFQQQRMDEYVASLSADIERAGAARTVAISGSDAALIASQRLLVDQVRQLRATGRVVLQFKPDSSGDAAVPRLPLEDGDVFRVPSRPNTVSVVGAVYGQNVFLYESGKRLGDYVALAGKPTRIADSKHAFIIRADGSVFSRERAQGTLSNNFEGVQIYPGDAILIPEKIIKPAFIRQLLDYSQVLSGFGLAAAAINVVR